MGACRGSSTRSGRRDLRHRGRRLSRGRALLHVDLLQVIGRSATSARGSCSHTRHLLRGTRGAYRLSGGSLGSAPVAGARGPAEWFHSSAAARPTHADMATSRRRRRCFRVGCHWRWWCGLVVGRLVAAGRESAFPAGRGRYRGTARPERGGGAHTTDWSKRHGRKRSAADRRGSASQSGSRHRDNHEDPSIRQKPGDSSSRATSQTLGEPFHRADPPEDHRTRLRARLRMDTKRSALHPHVAGRPRRYSYGHRRRPRRVNGARVDALLRRGLWQPARALTRAACRPSRGRAEGDPRWHTSTTSPMTRSKAHGVDPPAPRYAAEDRSAEEHVDELVEAPVSPRRQPPRRDRIPSAARSSPLRNGGTRCNARRRH